MLAIAGLLAGVVVVGLGRGSSIRDQRNAITNLASELQLARVAAMQRGESVEASIRVTPSGISCAYAEQNKEFPCSGLVVSSIEPDPNHNSETPDTQRTDVPAPSEWEGGVIFEPDGRTRSRIITFAGAGRSDTLLPHIKFDPISGAIELGRRTDPSPRNQGGADP